MRSREEFALGTIPGAINIPNDEVRSRLAEIPADRPVLLFCGVGLRGYLVERILRQHGWTDVANLTGGYKTWELATAAPEPVPRTRPGLCGGLGGTGGPGHPGGTPAASSAPARSSA